MSRTGGCRDVIRLARMGNAMVVGRQPIGCRRSVNKGRVQIADQACVARILHHDDEDMLEVLELSIAHVSMCRSCKRHHQRQGYNYRDPDASYETHATSRCSSKRPSFVQCRLT